MERQWITLTGRLSTGTVSRRQINYPGWRCTTCDWTIGTRAETPPAHQCPAPKRPYPLIECERCHKATKPWLLQAVYTTIRQRDLYCGSCYAEWLAEMAADAPSLAESLMQFYAERVTFTGLGHGDVLARTASASVILKRAGFGGKHGYRLTLRNGATHVSEHVMQATGASYAKVVAAMLLYGAHHQQDVPLPPGGKTAAEAIESVE